jgi:hypothetical protein
VSDADERRREILDGVERYLDALVTAFTASTDQHRAHERAAAVLADMAADPSVLGEALRRHISEPSNVCSGHYPVVSLEMASNPHFELVANCWITLPGGSTDLTTKAVHHHGSMLLSTVTAFGPGYEHWTFAPPELADPEQELFKTALVDRAPHPLGHVAFVDQQMAHVPMYPPSLTVTYALWSGSRPVSWRDRVKRLPAVRERRDQLRRLATRAGLAKSLDLKNIEYFDFIATPKGFVGMRDRVEFGRGPVADRFQSVLHVIQATGNEDLAGLLERATDRLAAPERSGAATLLSDFRAGAPITGRLSTGHTGVSHANFTTEQLQLALAASARLRSGNSTPLTA